MKNHRKGENEIIFHITPADEVSRDEVLMKKRESKEKQARSFLRNEFLGVLFTITNQPVRIHIAKTREPLDATFAGSDFTFSAISVHNLNTVLGVESHSLLRTSDITSITYEL